MSDKFQILWLDDTTARRTVLRVGENIIGNIIDADNKSEQIIKPAAVIELSPDDEISIKPFKGISCYVKNEGTSRWKSASSNWSTALNVRDTCLLFPVKIWLKVISLMDNGSEVRSPKRKLEEIIDDGPVDKRCRTEVAMEVEPSRPILCNSNHEPLDEEHLMGDEGHTDISNMIPADSSDTISMQSSNFEIDKNIENQPSTLMDTINKNEEEQDFQRVGNTISEQSSNCGIDKNNIEIQPSPLLVGTTSTNEEQNSGENGDDLQTVPQNENNTERSNDNNSLQNDNGKEATNDDNTKEETVPKKPVPREKCKYGEKCYRLNQEHKKEFSHPQDDDYNLPDDRPECPYGLKCYRKNPQHKLDYKHTLRKPAPKRSQSPLNLSDSENDFSDESVDESEYEASFIDDEDDDDDDDDFEDLETELYECTTEDEDE